MDLQALRAKINGGEMPMPTSGFVSLQAIANTPQNETLVDEQQPFLVEGKRIKLLPNDISIAIGDNAAEIISFKLPRYIDAVDITTKTIMVAYTNAVGGTDKAFTQTTDIGDDYVIVGWIIDNKVTYAAGKVKFNLELTNDNGYTWRTYDAEFNVTEALVVDGSIPEPEPSWIVSWQALADGYLKQMQEKLSEDISASRVFGMFNGEKTAQETINQQLLEKLSNIETKILGVSDLQIANIEIIGG